MLPLNVVHLCIGVDDLVVDVHLVQSEIRRSGHDFDLDPAQRAFQGSFDDVFGERLPSGSAACASASTEPSRTTVNMRFNMIFHLLISR